MHNGIDHDHAHGVGGGPIPQPQPVQPQEPNQPPPVQPTDVDGVQDLFGLDVFERPSPQAIARAQAVAEAQKPENNPYVKWVKENLPDPNGQGAHLNGPDGKPSVQRAENVYKFVNFYADTLADYGIDIRKDPAQWKDMTWHTLHAFMSEADTFSGDVSWDFLGRRLTLHGEGTKPPTDDQIKKFMGHFYHISGHVTNRADVKNGLDKPEVKAALEQQGLDPKNPGNLIYWGNGGKVAGLNRDDSGYAPKIASLNLADSGYAPKIAPLNLGDAGYNPNIKNLSWPDPSQGRLNSGFQPIGPCSWSPFPPTGIGPGGDPFSNERAQQPFFNDPISQQVMRFYFQQMIWSLIGRLMLLRGGFAS